MQSNSICLIIVSLSSFLPYVVTSCNSNQFQCDSGSCIQHNYLCDGGDDCNDRSDETRCDCRGVSCYRPPPPTLPPCKHNEFRCTSGACIPQTWECDGDYDCADLSDEHNTCEKKTCEPHQFTCDNGVCIDSRLKCNTKNDCGDNSDETICQIHPANENGTTADNLSDCGDYFRCKDGTCLPMHKVCDLTKDCPDGSDESDGHECLIDCASSNQCDHGFQKTPSGCLCTCRQGYRLAGDGLTCIDMLECAMDPPVCSQLCIEEVGSYSCGCFKEYTIRYDNITCKSNGSPMSIYFAVRNEIRQYVPTRRNLRVVHVEGAGEGELNALEVDIAAGMAYYSIKGNNTLHQLDVGSANRKSITNVGEATRIALDWITKNVYFVTETRKTLTPLDSTYEANTEGQNPDQNKLSQLQVCNVSGRLCAMLIKSTQPITALAVDAMNKYIFYATIDEDNFQSQLHRVGLDGLHERTISTFNSTITDITVDYRHKHVYIAREATIDRLNYDGSRMINIVETSMQIKGLNILEDHLYFLTEAGVTMHKCSLYGDTRRCTSFRLSAETTEMFAIAQMTRQTPGRNACVNYNCSHLCVPTAVGATCLCEDGKAVDEMSDCREWEFYIF